MEQGLPAALQAGHADRRLNACWGFRADDVLGRPCHEVMRGRDPLQPPVLFPLVHRRTPARLREWSPKLRYPDSHQAGKVIWLNVSSLPVPSRKKDRFLFAHLFRDITKRMRILGLAEELHTLLATSGGHPLADTTRCRSIGSPPSVVSQ